MLVGALVLTAIISPRHVLGVQQGRFDSALAMLTLFFGFVVAVGVAAVVAWITAIAPKSSSARLAATYVGEGAGILVSASRYLAFAMLAVLGAGLATTGIDVIIPLGALWRWVLLVVVLATAIPALLGRTASWQLLLACVVSAVLVLVTVLSLALIHELMGNTSAAQQWESSSPLRAGQGSVVARSLAAVLFPAGVFFVVSERGFSRSGRRRYNTGRLLQVFALTMALILITVYFAVTLHMWSYPTVILAESYLGRAGGIAAGVAYAALGIAVSVLSYWSLPRLVKELATERLLPHYLASSDAFRPRAVVIGVTAVFGAAFSFYLVKTPAAATILTFSGFTLVFLTSLTMAVRARSTLRTSLVREERQRARTELLGFTIATAGSLGLLVLIAYADPLRTVIGVVSLVVPATILFAFRRGRIRAVEKLAPASLTAGRTLPTRVHGVVLVSKLDMPTLRAVSYARAARLTSLTTVTVDFETDATAALRREWREAAIPVSLTVLGTPLGASTTDVVEYIRSMRSLRPADIVMVFIPRVIATSIWHRFFISHSTPRIIAALRMEEGVVICEVPFQLSPVEVHHDES